MYDVESDSELHVRYAWKEHPSGWMDGKYLGKRTEYEYLGWLILADDEQVREELMEGIGVGDFHHGDRWIGGWVFSLMQVHRSKFGSDLLSALMRERGSSALPRMAVNSLAAEIGMMISSIDSECSIHKTGWAAKSGLGKIRVARTKAESARKFSKIASRELSRRYEEL